MIKHIYNCLSPKVVYNKYLGEFVVARCGRCDACLDARAASWVQRLDYESTQHKYCFFVTLQYDEQHVHQFVRLRHDDTHPKDGVTYLDPETGQVINYYDKSVVRHDAKSLRYCHETKFLLVNLTRDYQLFMKRLRKEFKELDNERLRFFLTLEYGPTTFRPHAHCIFFFSSSLCAENFKELCDKAWQNGDVFDPHPVVGSASQYVASYVNSFVHLPAIYLHKDVRQKSLFSKVPPIGTLRYGFEEIRELFFKGDFELTIFDRLRGQFRDVPIWSALRNRIYPRLQGFSKLSVSDRIALYRLGASYLGEGARCFADYLYRRYFTGIKGSPTWFYYYGLKAFYIDYVETLPDGRKNVTRRYNPDSVYRFARTILRVAKNAAEFGITIEEYVIKMSDWYEKLEKDRFVDYLNWQDEYFKAHPVSEYLTFDFSFVTSVNNGDISDAKRFLLDLYGYSSDANGDYGLSKYKCSDFGVVSALHRKIQHDNTKTKKATDYLLAHANKFGNVIDYYDLDVPE